MVCYVRKCHITGEIGVRSGRSSASSWFDGVNKFLPKDGPCSRIKISMSATGQKAGYTIFCRHRSTNTYTDQIIDSIRGSNCEVLKCPRKWPKLVARKSQGPIRTRCIFTWLVGKYQDIDALIYDRVELPPFHTSRPRTLINVQFIYKIHRSPSSHGWLREGGLERAQSKTGASHFRLSSAT